VIRKRENTALATKFTYLHCITLHNTVHFNMCAFRHWRYGIFTKNNR